MPQIKFKPLSKFAAEVLLQLWRHGPIWDGYLLSKIGRDELVDQGLVDRTEGFNFLTRDGVRVLAGTTHGWEKQR